MFDSEYRSRTLAFFGSSPEKGAQLKHAVLMAGLVRHNLQNIPVFNDFSFCIEAEDVNTGPVLVRIGGPNLMTVKDHQVAFCHGTLEANGLSGVVSRHSLEVLDK